MSGQSGELALCSYESWALAKMTLRKVIRASRLDEATSAGVLAARPHGFGCIGLGRSPRDWFPALASLRRPACSLDHVLAMICNQRIRDEG